MLIQKIDKRERQCVSSFSFCLCDVILAKKWELVKEVSLIQISALSSTVMHDKGFYGKIVKRRL